MEIFIILAFLWPSVLAAESLSRRLTNEIVTKLTCNKALEPFYEAWLSGFFLLSCDSG